MIADNISVEHILRALEEIDQYGIPKERKATRYFLNYEGKLYPPKYVISLANKYVFCSHSRFSASPARNIAPIN